MMGLFFWGSSFKKKGQKVTAIAKKMSVHCKYLEARVFINEYLSLLSCPIKRSNMRQQIMELLNRNDIPGLTRLLNDPSFFMFQNTSTDPNYLLAQKIIRSLSL